MSLATWKAQYYPDDAPVATSALAAVRASLQKWGGLYPEMLSQHGLVAVHGTVYERAKHQNEHLQIDYATCPLCTLYEDGASCVDCPLSRARDATRCDEALEHEDLSPYMAFICMGDPKPMITALEVAELMLLEAAPAAPAQPDLFQNL